MTRKEKKEELIGLFSTGAIFIGDLIDECFEFGQQHPHWISVEDELPQKGANIQMASGGWDEPMEGYYKGWNWQRKQHMFHSYIDNATWYNVTHWMPLPKKPILSNPEKTGKNCITGNDPRGYDKEGDENNVRKNKV